MVNHDSVMPWFMSITFSEGCVMWYLKLLQCKDLEQLDDHLEWIYWWMSCQKCDQKIVWKKSCLGGNFSRLNRLELIGQMLLSFSGFYVHLWWPWQRPRGQENHVIYILPHWSGCVKWPVVGKLQTCSKLGPLGIQTCEQRVKALPYMVCPLFII